MRSYMGLIAFDGEVVTGRTGRFSGGMTERETKATANAKDAAAWAAI